VSVWNTNSTTESPLRLESSKEDDLMIERNFFEGGPPARPSVHALIMLVSNGSSFHGYGMRFWIQPDSGDTSISPAWCCTPSGYRSRVEAVELGVALDGVRIVALRIWGRYMVI